MCPCARNGFVLELFVHMLHAAAGVCVCVGCACARHRIEHVNLLTRILYSLPPTQTVSEMNYTPLACEHGGGYVC